MTKWYESTLVRIEDASPNTKRFWLELPADEPFDFKAGQFVTMDLPIGEKRLQRWRSYSIANAPDGSRLLEFCISHYPDGLASTWFFTEAKVGTNIRFKGPEGTFTLPDPIGRELVLVCTGTGVAPFRSMLFDLQRRGGTQRGIHLIFGTRHLDGVLYREEFEQMTQAMPGFRYSVALSREGTEGLGERFRQGYVHQIYLNEYAGQRPPDADFYLCGWSGMIDEAVENLILKMGCERGQVRYELYG